MVVLVVASTAGDNDDDDGAPLSVGWSALERFLRVDIAMRCKDREGLLVVIEKADSDSARCVSALQQSIQTRE